MMADVMPAMLMMPPDDVMADAVMVPPVVDPMMMGVGVHRDPAARHRGWWRSRQIRRRRGIRERRLRPSGHRGADGQQEYHGWEDVP